MLLKRMILLVLLASPLGAHATITILTDSATELTGTFSVQGQTSQEFATPSAFIGLLPAGDEQVFVERNLSFGLAVFGTAAFGDPDNPFFTAPLGTVVPDLAGEFNNNTAATTVYFLFSNIVNDADPTTGIFSGTFAFSTTPFDPDDPDDSFSEANRTGYGVTVRDSIDSFDDVDFFEFEAVDGQVFEIDIDVPNSDLDSGLQIYNSAGDSIAFNDDGFGPAPEPYFLESFLSFTAPATGTYYVAVSSFNNFAYDPTDGSGDSGGTSTGDYELIIRPNVPALPPTPSTGDRAGFAVTIAGDYAAVGVRLADEGGFSNSGAVDIYKRTTTGTWGFLKRIVSVAAHDNAHFGHAVDFDDATGDLIVGEERQNGGGFRSGALHLFGRDLGGPDNFGLVLGPFSFGAPAPRDRVGRSVAITPADVFAGAPNADAVGADSGRAYRGSIALTGGIELIPLDRGVGDRFGNAISADADTVVVGAFRNDDMGSNSGSAYVFDRNEGGTDNFGQVVKLLPSDGVANDQFGYSVGISGDTAIVGSRFADTPTANQTGAIYVFERNEGGANNWGQTAKLMPGDVAAGDRFGSSVAIDGDFIVGGSPKRGEFGDEAGKAYAFRKVDGVWVESAELFNESVTIRDEFGVGVAVDGNSCIVGSWLDNQPGNNNSGSAHLFGL